MKITKDHKPNFGEEFAFHSLASMAICAGLSIQPTTRIADNYLKIDSEIIDPDDGVAKIRVQSKAVHGDAIKHYSLSTNPDVFSYPIEKKLFDFLATPEPKAHRIFVLTLLPEEPDEWAEQISDSHLACRHHALWLSLRGESGFNGDSKKFHINKSDIVTPDVLKSLVQEASQFNDIRI